MSSSIAIPNRKQQSHHSHGSSYGAGSLSSSSSSPSPYSGWAPHGSMSTASPSYSATSASPSPMSPFAERRPSLLGSSLSKSEYTVVNVAGPDGAPRLITCVKTSQGFDWNQDIFLPSYLDYDSSDLEHRPDPVQEIVLTDEEAAALLPQ